MSDLEGAGGRGEHFQVKQKQTSSIKTEEEDEEEAAQIVGGAMAKTRWCSVLKTITCHCGSVKTLILI